MNNTGETIVKKDMYLKSMGNTSSLAELRVECNCGARRVMSGAMQKGKICLVYAVQETIRIDQEQRRKFVRRV